jgi:uncharacterized protein YbjQ (UPF0145 family)
MPEISFTCPVCKESTITWFSGPKAVCKNCSTEFKHEKLVQKGHVFKLQKALNSEYKDLVDALKKRYEKSMSPVDWENVANEGKAEWELDKDERIRREEEKRELYENMITVTAPVLDGIPIKEYKGIVSGQSLAGVNIFKDVFAGFRNVVGGRSEALQSTMQKMREEVLKEMKEAAAKKGANAIISINFDFDEYSEGMIMLTSTGTAVVI